MKPHAVLLRAPNELDPTAGRRLDQCGAPAILQMNGEAVTALSLA